MRFKENDQVVTDTQTGLMWIKNASLSTFPMTWNEALAFMKTLNNSGFHGYSDWKLPNRRELYSIISLEMINPCLPYHHPFERVFTGYYWTSTSCSRLPDQAWYIHLGGARIFKGMKYGSYMVWPVRNTRTKGKGEKLETGQYICYDEQGVIINCQNTGQDAEYYPKTIMNDQRYQVKNGTVNDNTLALTWLKNANVHGEMVDWKRAFEIVLQMNEKAEFGYRDWRLPTIAELESITDMGQHSPALPSNHPFENVREYYWSSNTSMYDEKYAWALYLNDGAIGVGFKANSEFFLWPVRGGEPTSIS